MSAAERAAEAARDRALYDVGYVIIALEEHGTDAAQIVEAVLDMIELRMRIRRTDPVEALTGGPM